MTKRVTIKQFCNGFDKSVDQVRHLSKDFCAPLNISMFGYVRIYNNGCVSWVTTNPDQDCLLIESGALKEDPLINTPEVLKPGQFLWFHDRQFPGSEAFYRERAQQHQVDHGMVLIKQGKDYLETCCFSGLLTKRPLYNLFISEKALFSAFMDHFTQQLDRRLLALLDEGITIADVKEKFGQTSSLIDRSTLIKACGWKKLLKLSKREKECLDLLKQGYTYQGIGIQLKLSSRTVEHYIDSVKNKLGLDSRTELFFVAEKLSQLGLNNER